MWGLVILFLILFAIKEWGMYYYEMKEEEEILYAFGVTPSWKMKRIKNKDVIDKFLDGDF